MNTCLALLPNGPSARPFGIAVLALLAAAAVHAAPPATLAETGLYEPGSSTQVRAVNRPFTPQYALWSDGAEKRRWLYIPAGRSIDASRPDAWQFPPGTKLWKEFSHGQRVETRYLERGADGRWSYATYVWSADGRQALRAPAAGLPDLPAAGAPGGRVDIPSQDDCRACHEGSAVPVLGVSALQLSPDRDPNALHATPPAPDALDLRNLQAIGWLRHLPPALNAQPPRISAASPTERAALGYLHANCGHCHNGNGSPAPVRLRLAHTVADAAASTREVLQSMLDKPSRYRPAGLMSPAVVLSPGRPDTSVLSQRMHTRQPQLQMPPLGTRQVDAEALALIDRWVRHELSP
ncbi:MAG: hypothetical protein HY855_05785 [Burkholderiales bacterium]|nr:hypothetical protein [Burkholderiales bacterium]